MQRFFRISSTAAVALILMSALLLTPRRAEATGKKASKARLRVAVVIDASGSMKKQDPSLLSKVAAKLFVELAGPKDEVGIVEFGTSARLIDRAYVKGEAARKRLFKAIDKVGRSQECTDYLAGLETALSMFKGAPREGERRLIIFLTDGTYDPDRSNKAYYDLLSEKEKTSLWTQSVSKLWERSKDTDHFKSRPCSSRYKALGPAVRRGFKHAFQTFLKKKLVPSKVRVFAIGFGTALAGKDKGVAGRLSESLGLLKKVAKSSRGRTLIEHDVNKIPAFFAQIFAALVGAPVQGFPPSGKKKSKAYTFKVVKGTRALGVVVPTEGDKTFSVALQGPKKGGKKHPVRRQHNEVGTERRNKGRVLSGYRFFWIPNPAPGTYEITATAGKNKRFGAQVLMDVGLQLAWLDPKPKKVYAQKKKGKIKVTFGLRTASGEKVGGLSEKFMKDMQFAWHLSKKAGYPVLESGRPNFDPAAPMKPMSFTLDRSKLKEEEYAIAAWASHAKGFFELRKLTRPLEVVKYIRMEAIWKPVGFSKKATEGFKKSRWVTLKLKEDIKARQEFVLDLSKIPNRKHLTLRLSNTTPGCKVKDKKITADQVPICLHKANHRVSLSLALRDWTKSRDKDLSFEGEMVLTPKDPEIFKGTKSWKTQTKGKIIAWTFWDWVRFYRNWILLAFGLFVLILWLVGRALAGAFPKKATLYYFDLEDKTDEPSQFALGRRVKSHLPFVSAKHTIGGKGMPRSGKVLCVIRATSGGGFKILPESTVTYERDGEKSEAGEAFRGRYDEHYQAGERYEFWLTRRPSYDD